MRRLICSLAIGALALTSLGGCSSTPKGEKTQVYRAAEDANQGVLARALHNGGDINSRNTVKQWTPLHVAAYQGHKKVVRKLIEDGAQVNPQDVDGNTPLHLAAEKGHDSTVRTLLEEGHADPTIRNHAGQTPKDLATGNPEVIKALTKAGG